ncbi:MAG: PfkB family carbohydrate kinase [bacterium]
MGIVIVGSVALDNLRTPFGEIKGAVGGSAFYAACAASYLSPNVRIVGVVGSDFPKKYLSLLKGRGVDLEGLEIVKGGKTFHWAGYYDSDMNSAHTTATDLNVFAGFSPRLPESYRNEPFLFLGNIDPDLQLRVLDQIRGVRVSLVDTMNYWITSKPESLMKVIRRVNVVLLNEGEARQICNTPFLQKAARELLKMGVERIIIKKGEHGCLMFTKDSYYVAPAYPLTNLKDPTGAGDTFAGGLIGYLARSRRLSETQYRQGIQVGTALASFAVEDFSLRRLAKLTLKDIARRCGELQNFPCCPPIRFDGSRKG